MTSEVDPITLEVLRHRLWAINDEQGQVATQISGSPVVYESKDFNSVLQTARGESLFIGTYTTRLSMCLDFATRAVIERFSDSLGFEDGDAFITNDPWAGASHMNDLLMVMPIFWEGRIVAWTGLAMHETDVGGPNPGSFTVGAKDVYGEGPLIPPVRLVERGRFRPDIEAWANRNTRTPEMNGLDMRVRWAALNRTRKRIREVIEEYGVETFLGVQERILDLTRRAFQRRLRSLPDGTWQEEGFLDHDGNTNELYRICLKMTKIGDRLIFDYRGTSPQAEGSVNATRVGLEGGTLSAILPALCYDMAWSPAAIRGALEFISEPGTINNALHPAGVSMATVEATFATQHVASACIAKMLACSELREEAQANWSPTWQGAAISGRRGGGSRFTGILLDQSAAAGATSLADGMDTGGVPGSPRLGIANVETYEWLFPILYIYRKQSADTGGQGRRRGGMGSESLIVPHKARGSIDLTVLSHGASQPEARGLYGGYPSSIQVRLILHEADLVSGLRQGRFPRGLEEVGHARIQPLEAKQRTVLHPRDGLLMACAGGAGYGDPLDREPELVALDVRRGLVSRASAEHIYGVQLDADDKPDLVATDARRERLRAERLQAGRRWAWAASVVGEPAVPGPVAAADRQPAARRSDPPPPGALRIGDALLAIPTAGGWRFHCQRCRFDYGEVSHPKEAALWREVPMTALSPWNRFGLVDAIAVREFYCPACAQMMSVEVRKKGDSPILDMLLAAVEQPQPHSPTQPLAVHA